MRFTDASCESLRSTWSLGRARGDHVAHPVRPGVLHHEQLDMRLESEDGHEAAGHGQLKTQDRENLQNTNKTTSKLTAAHC